MLTGFPGMLEAANRSLYFVLTRCETLLVAPMSAQNVLRAFSTILLTLAAPVLGAAEYERTGGPYVPTPQAVVDAMLDFAKVGPRDFVVDLGSGDGRIVLTAAQRYNARGFGVDIDSELVQQSNVEAQRRGLGERVSFREQDVMQARIGEASVVTLYLLPGMMQSLQTKFLSELKPGTRIVSHDFPFTDWKPDRQASVDVPEKYGTAGNWKSTIFYWMVPAQLQGVWHVSVPELAPQPLAVTFEQQYQYMEGHATVRGKRVSIADGRIEGDRVQFKLAFAGAALDFRGKVEGDRIHGDALRAGRTVAWTATKVKSPTTAASR